MRFEEREKDDESRREDHAQMIRRSVRGEWRGGEWQKEKGREMIRK